MKSILKNALVGILLVAGTTKPVATLADVKASLIALIPADGKIVDSTFKSNIGTLNLSYPLWLAPQINKVLQRGTGTEKCTVWNGLNGMLPYVRTIDANHSEDKGKKLVTVTEDGTIICGILFTINNNEYTANFIEPSETMTLLNKNCMQIEHGFSAYQLPLKWILGAAAVVGGSYGAYRLGSYLVQQGVKNSLIELGIDPAVLVPKSNIPAVTPVQAAGVLAKGAGNVIGGAWEAVKGFGG